MSKLKLMTIVGTRPEIIRLAAVIKKCDKYFDQILVHTGRTTTTNSTRFSLMTLVSEHLTFTLTL